MSGKGPAARRGILGDALVFVLLGVFALFSTFLVLVCAQAYHGAVTSADENAGARVLGNYLTNKVRMGEASGRVRVAQTEAGPALILSQDGDGWDGEAYPDEADEADEDTDEDSDEDPGEDPDEGAGGYRTVIYCADGFLREMFMSAGDDFYPEDGEALCPARSLDIRFEEGLYTFTVVDGAGETRVTHIAARCDVPGEAVLP